MAASEVDFSTDQQHWTRVARQWTTWARTPGHDIFWRYREELTHFLGTGSGAALDVGCGEGRISRAVRELGYTVTACDVVPELVEAARAEDSAHAYEVASAAQLPFAAESFDLVVAYNMLMDVDDAAGAVREMARVLRPDGRLMISVVHPFVDRGDFADDGVEADLLVRGHYLEEEHFRGEEIRDGLSMSFAGWSRSLEQYVAMVTEAGLAVTALREPRPSLSEEHGPASPAVERYARLPLFLWLTARAV